MSDVPLSLETGAVERVGSGASVHTPRSKRSKKKRDQPTQVCGSSSSLTAAAAAAAKLLPTSSSGADFLPLITEEQTDSEHNSSGAPALARRSEVGGVVRAAEALLRLHPGLSCCTPQL